MKHFYEILCTYVKQQLKAGNSKLDQNINSVGKSDLYEHCITVYQVCYITIIDFRMMKQKLSSHLLNMT